MEQYNDFLKLSKSMKIKDKTGVTFTNFSTVVLVSAGKAYSKSINSMWLNMESVFYTPFPIKCLPLIIKCKNLKHFLGLEKCKVI